MTMEITDRCTSTVKSTGERCKGRSVKGANHCYFHGGQGIVRKHGQRNLVVESTRSAMATMGTPVDNIDPHEALLEEIARTAGHVRWLQAMITSMNSNDLVWQKTLVDVSVGDDVKGMNSYELTRHEAQASIWMKLYQGERTHLVQVCKVAIGAGIAERSVRLAEQQGELIVRIMKGILEDPDLELSEEQMERSHRIAARHLRLLAPPEPITVSVA